MELRVVRWSCPRTGKEVVDVEQILRWGVSDRDGYYFLQTVSGRIIRFYDDGVDGTDFTGWPDYSFEDYSLSVSYDCGSVNLEAFQGNCHVTIPLGRVRSCSQLKTWMHAVNARLPKA
ncbi:MAG: hypothetical protein HY421_01920 [Candidatus Kerfeldbacteria bacterium]|nr:hypothetical protein [Candidatus Kerfeldbacteria bacterium]